MIDDHEKEKENPLIENIYSYIFEIYLKTQLKLGTHEYMCVLPSEKKSICVFTPKHIINLNQLSKFSVLIYV